MARIFEKREALDPAGEREALRYGRFGPLLDEIRRERSNAEQRGVDPDEAERRFRAAFGPANKKLRAKQGEEARKSLTKELEKGI